MRYCRCKIFKAPPARVGLVKERATGYCIF
jgi:hypothetical protein